MNNYKIGALLITTFLTSNTVLADYKILFSNPELKKMLPNIEQTEITIYSSCKEVLDTDPSAQTGIYNLSIEGETLEVQCNMDINGGGWTLVAQGKEPSGTSLDASWMTNGWYNKEGLTTNQPFKMPDKVINSLKTDNFMAYAITNYGLSYALPKQICVYNHTAGVTPECHIRYNIDGTLQGNDDFSQLAGSQTGLFGGNYNGGMAPTGYSGSGGFYGGFYYMWVR